MVITAPYGGWKSPISSSLVSSNSIHVHELKVDPLNKHKIYWIEGRPEEKGRDVLIEYDTITNTANEVLPKEFSVFSKCHEYGGGAYTVLNHVLFFTHVADNEIYTFTLGSKEHPKKITQNNGKDVRFSDFVASPKLDFLICVKEDHTIGEGKPNEVVNSLIKINLLDNSVHTIAHGRDFYSSPSLSHDGKHFAFISWVHPNMPWDGTELFVGDLNDESKLTLVAGNKDESVVQPIWSIKNELYFISDRSNFWNLYKFNIVTGQQEPVFLIDIDLAQPQWVFGLSHYTLSDTTAICFGKNSFYIIDLATNNVFSKESIFSNVEYLHSLNENLYFIGSSPVHFPSVIEFNLKTGQINVLQESGKLAVSKGFISIPTEISFPTDDPTQNAFAWLYLPSNSEYVGLSSEKPPLLVKCHGGPTSASSNALNLSVQFWTTRGFAFLDVNHRGSTQYGRKFRNLLRGNWGVIDVSDLVSATNHVTKTLRLADENRTSIQGGSAGGYAVLSALTFYPFAFKAGASYYGISDVETLAKDTHKFESHYTDLLIGPYPEAKDIYVKRSPIHFTSNLNSSLVLFQGLDDFVVPPSQAYKMFEAIKEKGIPGALLVFEGEGHGFRKAENKITCLNYQLLFFSKVFKFDLAEILTVSHPVQELNL